MKADQFMWQAQAGWSRDFPGRINRSAQLVFVFAGTEILRDSRRLDEVRQAYPGAHILGCSTAGEIAGTRVMDDSMVITPIAFEHTNLAAAQIDLRDVSDSRDAGRVIAQRLDPSGLVHVVLLSNGLKVNGSELVGGLASHLPPGVSVTGGLAADGTRFGQTLVCADTPSPNPKVAAIGFYGDHLKVRGACMGGWDSFGPDRLITRSHDNVLYELDGRSALELYMEYLGPYAQQLPASALLFPLSVRAPDDSNGVVRAVLSVDDVEGSMSFAGNVPQGHYARLMRTNLERLIDSVQDGAQAVLDPAGTPDFVLLVSCVARKVVLKQRIEEEVEVLRDVLGSAPILAGFYSYGEISPFTPTRKCELHNQTMTITTFSER